MSAMPRWTPLPSISSSNYSTAASNSAYSCHHGCQGAPEPAPYQRDHSPSSVAASLSSTLSYSNYSYCDWGRFRCLLYCFAHLAVSWHAANTFGYSFPILSCRVGAWTAELYLTARILSEHLCSVSNSYHSTATSQLSDSHSRCSTRYS